MCIWGVFGKPWLGQEGVVPNGLKVVGGPHWKPPMYSVSLRGKSATAAAPGWAGAACCGPPAGTPAWVGAAPGAGGAPPGAGWELDDWQAASRLPPSTTPPAAARPRRN